MASTTFKTIDTNFAVPKGVVTVKGDLVPSGVLTLKKVVSHTTFSFQITDQTLRDANSRAGVIVSAQRTDGKIGTKLSHDFGKNLPKAQIVATQRRGGDSFSLDYTHFPTKSNAGIVEAIAKLGKENKLVLSHKLDTGLSKATYTLDKGEYVASVAITCRGSTLLSATKREGARSLKFGLESEGPKNTARLEWIAKPFKVTMSAPVSKEGLGTATTSLIWEKTIAL